MAIALGLLLIKAFKVKDTQLNTLLAYAHNLVILFKFDWYAIRIIYLYFRQIVFICRSLKYKCVKKVYFMSKPAKSNNKPSLTLLPTYMCSMCLDDSNMEILLSEPAPIYV